MKRNQSKQESNGNNEENKLDPSLIKVDIKQTLFIGFGFLSAMIAWSFYNFKIPIVLNGITGSEPGSWIRVGLLGKEPLMEIFGGALMTLDNIVAILLQPYFGKLSDRLESKYGRRTPFFLIGLPSAVFCLFILPFMSIIGLFIGVIVVFNLAMAFYRAPIMSLLPDKTPPQALSTANSFISLMGGLGFVIGMIVPTIVGIIPGTSPVITGELATQSFFWQDFWGFILTGAFMLVCLVFFLIKVKEVPTGDKFFRVGERPIEVDVYTQTIIPYEPLEEKQEGPKKIGFFDEWREIRKDEDKSAFWVLLAVFAYLFGFNALEYSFGRFATSFLQISEGMASLLLALLPVALILIAIPAGSLATKYGRLKIMKIGLVVMALCTLGLIVTMLSLKPIVQERDITFIDLIPVILLLIIAGAGYGLTHINALPVVWQLAPKERIGSYTGVYYMISALGAILSPFVMSTIYALIRYAGGDQWFALFPYFLTGVVVGFIFIRKVKKGDAEPLTREELDKLRAKYMAED